MYKISDKLKSTLDKVNSIFTGRYGYLLVSVLTFIICFLVMQHENYRLHEGNDDVWYTQVMQQFGSSWNFMQEAYKGLNGRYLTAFIMSFVMDKNIWLWRILNTIVLFLFFIYSAKVVYALFRQSKYYLNILIIFAVSSFFLLPYNIIHWSATWVTGSFNYLWSSTAFLILFYYFINSTLNYKKVKLYEFIILILVSAYAFQIEQTSAILLVFGAILMVYAFITNRYIDKYLLALYIIGIISSYILYTAPSVSFRYYNEVKTWYPMFSELSIIEKIIQGYPYTIIQGMFLNNTIYTFCLSILLFLLSLKQKNNLFKAGFAILPAIYTLVYNLSVQVNQYSHSIFYNVRFFSTKILDNNPNEPYISVIIGSIILLVMLYYLFTIKFSSFDIKWTAVLSFCAALASSFLLCFSPTIYGSGDRIFFIPYVMYFIVIGILLMEVISQYKLSEKFITNVMMLFFILACCNLVDNITGLFTYRIFTMF